MKQHLTLRFSKKIACQHLQHCSFKSLDTADKVNNVAFMENKGHIEKIYFEQSNEGSETQSYSLKRELSIQRWNHL